MGLIEYFKKLEPDKKKSPLLHTAYDAFFTFLATPNTVTQGGVHMRDGMDLKRTMTIVVLALQLCFVLGTYNIGHQHFAAMGQYIGLFEGFHLKLVHGLIKLVPLYAVTMIVGLGIEFYYAAKNGHAVEEGFLVSGALIPLIMPPDLPIWILALSVIFSVVLVKEAFGGTGMNIWNVALMARMFVFFAYPTSISGDDAWISGFEHIRPGFEANYGLAHDFFNVLFGWVGLDPFTAGKVVDGYTGATPLALAYQGGWEAVTNVYTESQMWWGLIPGSIGETCKPFIIVGALFLVVTGVGSWRIMFGMLFGAALMGMILNAWDATPFMSVPWYYQFYMGSFFFAMAFMATDPVTAASTNKGMLAYGFLIGFIGMIVRVLNPAYPEGWMLAIIFMNTFAPLLDRMVLNTHISKRLKSA